MEKIIADDNWQFILMSPTFRMSFFHPGSFFGRIWYVWTSEVNGKKLEFGSGGQLFPSG